MGKTKKIVKNADGTSTVTVGGKYAGKLPRNDKKVPTPQPTVGKTSAPEEQNNLSLDEIWETYKANIVEDSPDIHEERKAAARQHLDNLELLIKEKRQNRTCVPSDKNSRVHTLVLVASTRWTHNYGCAICGAQFSSSKSNGHPENYVTGSNIPQRDYEREFGATRPAEVFLEQKRTDWEKRHRFNFIAQKFRAEKIKELGYGSSISIPDVLEETLTVMRSEGYSDEELSEYVKMYSR